MSEDEARDWLMNTFGAASMQKLERFVTMLMAEAGQQSLIARSTFPFIWSRHIADSAQLLSLAPSMGRWIDVGSGGGLPGIVVAILRDTPLTMVEPRRKRADFLRDACKILGLKHADVVQSNVQSIKGSTAVLSARAVSNLSDLFTWTAGVVSRETQFLLPRGENAVNDMDVVARAWHGTFHVKQSITDPAAGIVVASDVRRR